jgi:hypothetical protein
MDGNSVHKKISSSESATDEQLPKGSATVLVEVLVEVVVSMILVVAISSVVEVVWIGPVVDCDGVGESGGASGFAVEVTLLTVILVKSILWLFAALLATI